MLTKNGPEVFRDRKYRNARSGSNAGQRLFSAGFAVGEAIAADDNRDQTCNLRDGACEKSLDSVKAGVEGTPLSVSRHR